MNTFGKWSIFLQSNFQILYCFMMLKLAFAYWTNFMAWLRILFRRRMEMCSDQDIMFQSFCASIVCVMAILVLQTILKQVGIHIVALSWQLSTHYCSSVGLVLFFYTLLLYCDCFFVVQKIWFSYDHLFTRRYIWAVISQCVQIQMFAFKCVFAGQLC